MNPMEISIQVLPGDSTLQQRLAALEAEGWQVVPNLVPAITYVMMRQQQIAQPVAEPGQAGFGVLTIDDSKVHHYRNGKLVEAGEGNG